MKKRRYAFLALALMAAGALLASGCKQAGGDVNKPDGGTKTPGTDKPSDNQGNKGKTAVTNALQFQGKIGPSDSTEAEKKVTSEYMVSVTLSDGRVGASAENLSNGFLYMGSAAYDEKSNSVNVTMVNVKNAEDTLSFAGTYQSATKLLKVTEFGDEERSAMLPLKSGEDINAVAKTYTVPVTLPQIGESVLLFRINGTQAAVAIIAGKANAAGGLAGNYGTLANYTAEGLVVRGQLKVKIPLDTKDITKALSVLEISATVSPSSGVSNIVSSILTRQGVHEDFDQADEGHLSNTVLPHFKPATFTFKGKDNKYYALVLQAEPAIVGSGNTRGGRESRETYRMTAYFVELGNTEPTLADLDPAGEKLNPTDLTKRSVSVSVEGKLTDKTSFSGIDALAKQASFEFDFPKGCFANTSYKQLGASSEAAKAIGFKITKWKPLAGKNKTDGKVIDETVVSGNFEIKAESNTGELANQAVFGSDDTKLSGGDTAYDTVKGTDLSNGKKANELFNNGKEGFKGF